MTEWQVNTPHVVIVDGVTYTAFMAAMGESETLPDGFCYVLTIWLGDWRVAQDEPKMLSLSWLESGSCYGVDLETLVSEALATA